MRVLRDTFGIDISDQRPQHLDTLAGRRFDHVITLCDRAREACPDFARPPAAGALEHPRPGHGRRRLPRSYPRSSVAADIDTRIRHLLPVLTATDHSEGPP